MRRIFWMSVGLGAGAIAAVMAGRWGRRQAERMAPATLAREAQEGFRDLARLLAEAASEFRRGVRDKEAEVRTLTGRSAPNVQGP